ncbi:MAG TPA: hypothetical protein VHE30_19330 [Polyangiaceae bacterium]|nr:hypothetical protein [Polyangiaceae bacterium]
MRFASIKEAKSRLYQLVEHAESGEEVVLLRGSTPVAAIVTLDVGDFELVNGFENARVAEALRSLAAYGGGALRRFESEEEAAEFVHRRSRRDPAR